MQALAPKQREFVLALVTDPFGNATEWARAAGYSDSSGAAKVKAHWLMHHPKVELAVKEVSRQLMHTVGPAVAAQGLLRIAQNPKHRDQFKALEALADRVGFHRQTEHVVAVQHTDLRGDALIERIKRMAAVMGLDAAKLLGENVAPPEMKVIEHQPVADGQE